MADRPETAWDRVAVRTWLQSRVVAARSDQVVAERGGRDLQDDCDKASAEEMVCSLVQGEAATSGPEPLLAKLQSLLDRDEYVWRGVYNDAKFDRHVRSFIRKLIRMTKTNQGFGHILHYQ